MQGVGFRPTDEQRRTVRAVSGFGIPQEDIGTPLEIDVKTMRKHFRREPDRGAVEATAKVAQSLFNMATQDKNVAEAIFWMKARADWREKHEVVVSTRPVHELSDEELAEIVQQGRDRLAIEAEPDEP